MPCPQRFWTFLNDSKCMHANVKCLISSERRAHLFNNSSNPTSTASSVSPPSAWCSQRTSRKLLAWDFSAALKSLCWFSGTCKAQCSLLTRLFKAQSGLSTWRSICHQTRVEPKVASLDKTPEVHRTMPTRRLSPQEALAKRREVAISWEERKTTSWI